MINELIESVLKDSFPIEIADKLLSTFLEVERNYSLQNWKVSELESGHFVESTRRALDFKLSNSFTPFNKSLGSFNSKALSKYENSKGHESYRIIIPRVLFSIYCIRNKRGVGHINEVSPNKIDASSILSSVKWTMAEILRLESDLDFSQTSDLIDKVTSRNIELLWKEDDFTVILSNSLSASDEVLVLLLDDNPQGIDKLFELVNYTNKTHFKNRILKRLENEKLIKIKDNQCFISPLGIMVAENLILKHKEGNYGKF